jgi:hypothetical protein
MGISRLPFPRLEPTNAPADLLPPVGAELRLIEIRGEHVYEPLPLISWKLARFS